MWENSRRPGKPAKETSTRIRWRREECSQAVEVLACRVGLCLAGAGAPPCPVSSSTGQGSTPKQTHKEHQSQEAPSWKRTVPRALAHLDMHRAAGSLCNGYEAASYEYNGLEGPSDLQALAGSTPQAGSKQKVGSVWTSRPKTGFLEGLEGSNFSPLRTFQAPTVTCTPLSHAHRSRSLWLGALPAGVDKRRGTDVVWWHRCTS